MFLDLPYCFYNLLLVNNITRIIQNFDKDYLQQLTFNDFKKYDNELNEGRNLIRFEIFENELYWNFEKIDFKENYQIEQNGGVQNYETFKFRSEIFANKIKQILKKYKIKNTTFLLLVEDGLFRRSKLAEQIQG